MRQLIKGGRKDLLRGYALLPVLLLSAAFLLPLFLCRAFPPVGELVMGWDFIFSAIAFQLIVSGREREGVTLSGLVALSAPVLERGLLPFPLFFIPVAFSGLLTLVAFIEIRKLDAIKQGFTSTFLTLKKTVQDDRLCLSAMNVRVSELETEIRRTEDGYVFSKSIGNVISKEEMQGAVEGGFRKMNLDAEFIFFVRSPDGPELFFTSFKDRPQVANIIKDNLWIEKSGFIEIHRKNDQNWDRYWSKVFPGAKMIYVYPMKVTGETLGHIVYVFSGEPAPSARIISVSDEITLGIKKVLLYEKLKEMARRDTLTGLFLRRYFFEKLESELRRARRYRTNLALVMCDLDHFKAVNDTFGHAAGDLVLSTVASEIAGRISDVDFAARYGGEEFSIALVNYDRAAVIDIVEKIREGVEGLRLRHNGAELRVTVSLGISFFDVDGLEPAELVRRADQRLYAAKSSGRNRVESDDSRIEISSGKSIIEPPAPKG